MFKNSKVNWDKVGCVGIIIVFCVFALVCAMPKLTYFNNVLGQTDPLSMYATYTTTSTGGSQDPAFGYTVMGSSVWSSVAPTVMPGCEVSLSQAGALTSIVVYTCGSGSMVAAIYADDSGVPGVLIAYSGSVVLSAVPSWVSFPVSASLAAGSYWLAVVSNAYPNLYYDVGTANQGAANYASSEIYPTCPSSFNPTSWAYSSNELSMYATYTTTPTPTPISSILPNSVSDSAWFNLGIFISVSHSFKVVDNAFYNLAEFIGSGLPLYIQLLIIGGIVVILLVSMVILKNKRSV